MSLSVARQRRQLSVLYKIIGADDREYGPISLEQLRAWQTQGRVNAQTRVLVAGETNWKTIADLPELASIPPVSVPQPIQPLAGQNTITVGQRTNGFAVAGFVLGLLSLFSFCCCAGLPFNLLGFTCSIIGLVQINNRPAAYTGKGLAIAGLITSALSLLFGIGVQVLGVALNWDEIAREF